MGLVQLLVCKVVEAAWAWEEAHPVELTATRSRML